MKPKYQDNMKFIIMGGIYVLLVIMTAVASSAVEADSSLTFISALLNSFTRLSSMGMEAFRPASPHFISNLMPVTLIYGVGCLLYHLSEQANKRMAPGKENGSAQWNTNLKAYDKQYTYPYGKPEHSYENNVILTQNVFLGTDGRQTKRNLNTLVIGGSGAGKSRFYVKPNLLQSGTNSSFVITDPSGELLESTGTFLEQQGYKIMVLNLTNMAASYCYNPFEYIRKEEDVLVLINCLIKNTTPPGSSKGDPFWEKSETALLTAIFFYLRYHRPEEDRSFASVMRLLRAANIDENDSSSQSPLDVIFEEIGKENPNDMGYKSYMTFRMGAGKTLKSILISCAVRLNAFETPAVAALVRTDYDHMERNINLKDIGFKKSALFCILPQADDTYNFIVSMLYYQLFESLYYYAEHEKEGLKYNVRFMLDEFCNIGQIPDFDKKLATMRKYGLSCSIIVQNLKQLEEMYDKKTEGLIGNCDSILFLGSSEYSTLEFVSKKLGDATIVVRNTSRSQGRSGSSSMSFNRSARKLMTPDEVGRIGEKNCILFIRECLPFFGPKYEVTRHPNYKYTSDNDKANTFDIEKKFVISSEQEASAEPAASPEASGAAPAAAAPKIKPQNLFARISKIDFISKLRDAVVREKPADNDNPSVEDLFAEANAASEEYADPAMEGMDFDGGEGFEGGYEDDYSGGEYIPEMEDVAYMEEPVDATASRESSAVPTPLAPVSAAPHIPPLVTAPSAPPVYTMAEPDDMHEPEMPEEPVESVYEYIPPTEPILDNSFGEAEEDEDIFDDASSSSAPLAPLNPAPVIPQAAAVTAAPVVPKNIAPAPAAAPKTIPKAPKKPEPADYDDLIGMLEQGESDYQKQKEEEESARAMQEQMAAQSQAPVPPAAPSYTPEEIDYTPIYNPVPGNIAERSESVITVKVEKKTLSSLKKPQAAPAPQNAAPAAPATPTNPAPPISESEKTATPAAQIRQIGLLNEDDESEDDFGISETAYYG